mmetsp:Transcript_7030/g.10437  ORF Transcript_7030/g.10437 Transcript_7030/m.10437 type:complete len:593 (+) Transcript_7030:143-1921(+)
MTLIAIFAVLFAMFSVHNVKSYCQSIQFDSSLPSLYQHSYKSGCIFKHFNLKNKYGSMSTNFRQFTSLNSELQTSQIKWKHSFTRNAIANQIYNIGYQKNCPSSLIATSTALAGSANRLNDINLAAGDRAYNVVSMLAELLSTGPETSRAVNETQRNLPIALSLQKIQSNMDTLDNVAGRTPQLSRVELLILMSTVLISGLCPFVLDLKVVEVLVPSMAAVSASIGISAEYIGKVAVSKGKEVSALAIQAAAESEILLALAERTKAVLPLCVGIATTASAFALLAPSLSKEIADKFHIQVVTEIYLICPLIAVLAAAIAGLATQESRLYASRATGLGNRRFASSKDVGRTWMSATEQVESSAKQLSDKWIWFAVGVLPAPLIAALCPGALSFKAIVCAAVAAAQAASYLSIAEYFLSSAVEAVALKARSSAVADTYANQSSRAGSILPFTSALAGLCAAASAAAVELLPLISVVELQSFISVIFPSGAALFAAAASVAKARCEVDALAASEAASKGISGNGKGDQQKDPLKTLIENISISVGTSATRVITRVRQFKNMVQRGLFPQKLVKWLKKLFRRNSTPPPSVSALSAT